MDIVDRLRGKEITHSNTPYAEIAKEAAAEIIRLRKERDEARAAMAWQPIETAPKDETEILVGKYINGEWRVCQSAWCHFPGHDNHVQGYEPDVWWWHIDADWGGITDDEGPAHWMPLTPPEATK